MSINLEMYIQIINPAKMRQIQCDFRKKKNQRKKEEA